MDILASTLDAHAAYKLLSGMVVPRPIAWVTTVSRDGIVNLAPFSSFTLLCESPPMIGINISRGPHGRKDTARNIVDSGEFVVNVASQDMSDAVHASGVEHGPHVSEVDLLGLKTAGSRVVRPPRLADVPVSLECRLHQTVAIGHEGSEFFIGEVVSFHARDGLVVEGKVDTDRLDPLSRIGGPRYAGIGNTFNKKLHHST